MPLARTMPCSQLAGAAGQRLYGPSAGPCPGVGGFTLACPGAVSRAAVLDLGGRYAGHRHRRGRRHLHRGAGPDCRVVWGLCRAGHTGDMAADRSARRLRVSGGDVVTTPSGDWLGTLAAAPMPDADG